MIYIYLIIINIISLLMFGIDKLFAIKHKFRISEKNLILVTIFGGSFGSLLGMFLFKHKTKKIKFKFIISIIFTIQTILFIKLIFLNYNPFSIKKPQSFYNYI